MCDTVVALGSATADGKVLFAKNSDREPNEAQRLIAFPRQQYAPGTLLRCTYLEIPQVQETHAVLLSQPFWMWGCEMGINEHGVTIGNEAVFTRVPYARQGALLGMDLVRLGLERGATAGEALDVIVTLLERYGQGGSGGYTHGFFYHNAFLIADPQEAWVLETAGRYWAAVKVRDFYTISNGLTIGETWDKASSDLVSHALEMGWCRSEREFHFARCYSDRLYTHFGRCRERRQRSLDLLAAQAGAITVQSMMALLRDHGAQEAKDPGWDPASGSMRNLCNHAGLGPLRGNQTVNSMIAHLDPALLTVWSPGTAAPCTALFKPIWPEAGLPDLGPELGGAYDPETVWWQHEHLHRLVLEDYPVRLGCYRAERDLLEAELIAGAEALAARTALLLPEERRADLRTFSEVAFREARERTEQWIARVISVPPRRRVPSPYRWAWTRFNRKAGMPF